MRQLSPLLPKLPTHACNDNGVIRIAVCHVRSNDAIRIAVQASISLRYVSDGVFVITGEVAPWLLVPHRGRSAPETNLRNGKAAMNANVKRRQLGGGHRDCRAERCTAPRSKGAREAS